ncbi:MAG: hypothetical protein ACTHJ8_11475 [Mucilaginibacter sp.]
MMKQLSEEQADQIKAGHATGDCGYNIVMSASLGGLFGGAGAVIGALAAATGPSCLSLW